MTLEQLRIFVAVAEREHVTRAAEALHMTQSAVSGTIAALEARHGVALFNRVGRGIELTEAGRLFLDEARAVLARAAHAEALLADLAGLARGTLHLVASQTIASYWLPPRLAAFTAEYPQIAIELSIDNSEGAAARVREGKAELGFVEGMIDEPALVQRAVARDAVALIGAVPVAHIDAAWLRAARWIMRERGSGTRSTFEEMIRAHGLDPAELDCAMTLPSNEAVLTAVETGAGVAMLSRQVVARAAETGRIAILPVTLPDRPFHLIRHSERRLTRAADALIHVLEEYPA